MQNNKTKKFTLLFMIYIIAIVTKDYIFPRVSYLANDFDESAATHLRDALLQFNILFTSALLFFAFKYKNEKNQVAIEKQERVVSFSGIMNWNHCSRFNIILCVIMGIASYVSFQLFKNVYLIINYSITNNETLIPTQQTVVEVFPLVMFFLIYVLWAALSEEVFYRSMLFGEILKGNRLFAYLFSVVIFALAHNSVEQIIQATFLAIVLCIVFEKTESILPCIVIHIIYNTLGVINTYIYSPNYGISREDIFMLTQYDYWLEAIKLGIIGISVFGLIAMIMSKIKKSTEHQNEETGVKFDFKELILISIIFILGILKFYSVIINYN